MGEEQEVRYKVVFLGPAEAGVDSVNKLTAGLRDRFNLSIEAVSRIMKLAPIAVKEDVTLSEGQRYKTAFETIGANVRLEPIEEIKEVPHEVESPTPPTPEREPQTIPLRARTPGSPYGVATTAEGGQKMLQCPQCGFVQPEADECIKCGVVISKFVKYQEEVKVPKEERAPVDYIGTPGEEETEEGYTPWEDIANLGVTAAFLGTFKKVLSTPDVFFQKMPVNKGIINPLLYGVILGSIGGLFTLLWQYALQAMVGGLNLIFTSTTISYAIFLPVLIAIFLFVGSGIIHIALMVVGGNRSGFEATFRVLSYSNSIQLITIIPILGALFFLIYYPTLLIVGLSESHRITMGRAAFGVFCALFVAVIIIVIISFAIFLPLITALQSQMMQQPPRF